MGRFGFLKSKGSNIEDLIKSLDNKDEDQQEKTLKKIISIGSSAVDLLIVALKSNNLNIKMNAAVALGEIGDARAIEPLLQGLNENIRIQSIVSLGKIRDRRAEKPLFDVLNDENGTARAFAAEALSKMGHIEPLLLSVRDNDEFVKRTAIQALVNISDPRKVEAISYSLKYAQDWATRYLAAQKLGEIGDIEAKEALTLSLNDNNSMVRDASRKALQKLTQSGHSIHVKNVNSANSDQVEQLIAELRAVKPSIPTINRVIDLIRALEKTGDKRAIVPLMETASYSEMLVMEVSSLGLPEFQYEGIKAVAQRANEAIKQLKKGYR